jgi:hypothetical protein
MSKRRKKPTRIEAAPAVADLLQRGWCRRDAEHLALIELALATVGVIGTQGGRVMSEHAATALAWEPVLCGARALYTEPEHGVGWRALAGYQEDPPMRTLMLRLAAVSEGLDVVEADADDLTAEDLRLASLAIDAENRGEFAEALRLLGMSPRPLDDPWTRDLERVVSYGDQFTAAQWGRWICSAALRWCQSTSRGLELGVHHASIALRALGASEEVVQEHAPRRSAYDQTVHDALLFDEGSLRAFLELELAPMLADKVPGIQSWPDAAPRVVRLIARSEGGALCEDVLGGGAFVVGDELLGEQHPPGRLFFGRLVQVDGDDRHFFAILPTVLEDECAALELAVAVRDGAAAGLRIELMHSGMRASDAA